MNLSPVHIIVFCLVTYLVGMLHVWGWAIGHLVRRRPLSLPEFTPRDRAIPWGMGTMVLVLLLYLGVNMGVIQVYLAMTGRSHARSVMPKLASTVAARTDTPPGETKTDAKSPEGRSPQPKIASEPSPRHADSEDSLLSVTEGMFLLTLINEMLIVAIPGLVRLTSGTRLSDLGLTFTDWPTQIKIGAAGALLIAPVVYLIQFSAIRIWAPHSHPVEDMIKSQFTPSITYLAALSAVFIAPIVEEMMFRGLVQRWLYKLASREPIKPHPIFDPLGDPSLMSDPARPEVVGEEKTSPEHRSRRAALQAIGVTSFFFAIVHSQQWPAPIPIFLLSMALGIVYHLTGSLMASIAMHATFNSISTFLLMLSLALPARPDDLPTKTPPPKSPAVGIFPDSTSPGGIRISTTE